MKRILTILAATLLLTAAMAGTASASSYDSVAEELSAIGVFRGTAGGFELDRAPTRSEAAIMLVRLYGAEDEAKAAYEAGEISMPFTDVSETAAPSVAWLYSQGITNGTSATTFGASSPCSAKMYCAFLLRALGYEDGVDFLYADTLDFAMLHGLFNLSMLDAAPFLRDDLAAVTYQALGADLKDGSTYLLASLVESGAIDAEAARPITEKIEAYRALTAASQASSTGIDADYTMNMGMDIAVDGSDGTETIHETMSVAVSGNGRIQMISERPAPAGHFHEHEHGIQHGRRRPRCDHAGSSLCSGVDAGRLGLYPGGDGRNHRPVQISGWQHGRVRGVLPGDAADQRPDEQHDAAHDRLHRRLPHGLPHRIHHEDG